MDWDDFRALEYFSIIYDIAVDEKQYNPKWCQLSPPKDERSYIEPIREPIKKGAAARKPWATPAYFLFPDRIHPGDLPNLTITASFDPSQLPFPRSQELPERLQNGTLNLPALKQSTRDPISTGWRKLLLAKYIRAILQKRSSTTALEALDRLGLALLRAMPLLECEIKPGGSELQVQSLLLKILFLNEAAACYHGYHSISLADDCLNLIKHVFTKGRTPYELVAIYNKAQGYLHIRDYYAALREFEEVASCDPRENTYFALDPSANTTLRNLCWPDEQELFALYVGYPSVLQGAVTLLNLQRSWEAEKRLEQEAVGSPKPATAHQRARRSILIEQISNDRCLTDSSPNWAENGKINSLKAQRLGVEIERSLTNCKLRIADDLKSSSDKPAGLTTAIRNRLAEFGSATKKLKARMKLATKNLSEIDDTCLSWAEGLSVCKELLALAHSRDVAGNYRVSGTYRESILEGLTKYFQLKADNLVFRDITVDLCTDRAYRSRPVEVRKTLLKNLSSIHSLCAGEPSAAELSRGAAKCLKDLLDKLIDEPPRFASRIEIQDWREQRGLLGGGLSDGDDDHGMPQKELQSFMGYGFVHPTEDDVSLDTAQKKGEVEVWRKCQKEHQCFETDRPSDCGGAVLARNPGFTCANIGAGTLHHLDRLVDRNRKTIEDRLYTQRVHDSGWHFVVLQRWNSFTPAMRASEGGGYFLFHSREEDSAKKGRGRIDVGVVIDPGYGFVKNFVSEGFGVLDITAIVITHDHPDHLADVGSLVNLLVELKKNRGGTYRKPSKVEMLLSRGAFERLSSLIESARDVFRDTVVLEPGMKYDVWCRDGTSTLALQACHALHRDASDLSNREGFDSVGIIAEIRCGVGPVRRIGIPSDTKWNKVLSREFTGQCHCDLICLHLGSIVPEGFPLMSYFDGKKTGLKVLHEKQQLYLPGVVWYLEAIREHEGEPTMVILSEFGEELAGGARIDIARRLQAYTDEKSEGNDRVVILPGDVGLCVDPVRRSVRCSCCGLHHPWTTSFHCETSGDAEQILYICPWCFRNHTQQDRAEIFLGERPSATEDRSRWPA